MSRSNGEQPNQLSAEIRRQMGTAANTRFLRALPLFRADPEIPEPFVRLLREIDRAERRERRVSRG